MWHALPIASLPLRAYPRSVGYLGYVADYRWPLLRSIATSSHEGESRALLIPTAEKSVQIGLGRFGTIIRRGLVQTLSKDNGFRVVGTELDAGALQGLVKQGLLQVILLDEASSPCQATLRSLRAADPRLGLVVLASGATAAYGRHLLAAGANACLSKDLSDVELLSTVSLAADGKYVQPLTWPGHADGGSVRQVRPLSLREQDVFAVARLGHSNAIIARELHISVETVRTHLAHIYGSLGIKSRRELREIDPLVLDVVPR